MGRPPEPERYAPAADTPTRTTLLADAAFDPDRRKELCERYAAPVYWHYRGFLTRSPNARETAEELLHGFLIHFFLSPPFKFTGYEPTAGSRFLYYVISSARKYGTSEYRKSTAEKRGGGRSKLELDADPARYEVLIRDRDLTPDEQAEWAYSLDRLARAAAETRARLEAVPDQPVDRALYDHLVTGTAPKCERIARAHGVTSVWVRQRWDSLLADRSLLPYLTNPPPPYAELGARTGFTYAALTARFSRLLNEVRQDLVPLLVEELGAEGGAEAAKVVTRLFDVVDRISETPQPV
jgi:hypothetical protein